ncbi:COX15/CtaA family protein [Aquirufa sp. OSTEICH-129V]|jgi:cytochrome c oxidase assembly protein subunit 15|uniref:COX15/CtaA family protein n=1 Tax=Aquirufa avitistagni TaxID=3104728 RepID=A0ABW6DDN7_9BACT
MTFQRFGYITLFCLYLLVLAGGIVRSTGSGMGCPDWPRCFGQWVPPTHASELPLNYQEIYQEKLHGEIEFNATKTWIEYLNRLLGALTGLFMAITTLLAWKESRRTFLYTFAAFVLVMANAILGKYVVDSFLLPGVVTAHMLLTTGVLFFLLKALNNSAKIHVLTSKVRSWILINAVIIFAQILLGTQVRENMDHVIVNLGYGAKNLWIDQLDMIYIIHRTFSWLILLSHLYLWKLIPMGESDFMQYKKGFVGLISLSLLSGVIMAYIALPLGSQPIHLASSLLLLGLHIHAWQRTERA